MRSFVTCKYYFPDINRMMKSRRMLLAGHIALFGEGFWWKTRREETTRET
jgi:hypothetical protein